ncbi:LicD family protein [Alkalimonas delamerensis]|uniref:LicD family protein n=1 Tax=Alkalimonas delamerensis TaxID=265981 RepID=A0ABT9GN01_9GAMM|nr:LicD family protein [Alkalimonas delamerensis]MDP4528329.1 LicD family protein [Alkalimonas delamerensis]
MKKVVLFGAGAGGKRGLNYYKNESGTEVIAICDNNVALHGLSIGGVSVIPVSELRGLCFDEVVICSMFFKPILTQLKEIQIEEEKIKIAPARVVKGVSPMGRGDKYMLSKVLLKELSNLLQKNHIPHYIDHGTLLGIVRDNDLLPWDDDVDLGLPSEYADQAFDLISIFLKTFTSDFSENNRWRALKIDGDLDTPEGRKSCCRIIKIYNEDDINNPVKYVDFFITYKVGKKRYWKVGDCTLSVHSEIVEELNLLPFEDHYLPAPINKEDYLTCLYKNWRVPNKEWSHSQYNNIC